MIRLNSTQNQIDWGPSPSPTTIPIDFSPPLIAMVVVVATAFFIVAYFRLISRHLLPPIFLLFQNWRHRYLQWRWRHHSPSTNGDIESHQFDSASAFHYFTSYNGLDDDIIKTIPLSIYTSQKSRRDCAVCLVEFEENDYVRTLPVCAHAFHVDCIDVWLNSHANCPLCRAGIFRPDSPFIPLMAARIRPSLDGILESIIIDESNVNEPETVTEIVVEDDHRHEDNQRDFVFKRSYSFGATDRIVMEAATATPWRYRRGNHFWSIKRPSPFNTMGGKNRVFSFRHRGMKSPFFRRRSSVGSGLFPLSESNVSRFAGSSRRSKSMTSPMFLRSSTVGFGGHFSSSRLRCGDLEALLSPERLNRRYR
ncbi:RING-type E3 ubiquitin transferase [Ranunculus cassubicifolius]